MDGDYFKSYENLSSHDVMLKDTRRLKFYREFCNSCSSKFIKDKVVLDLGCGTGVLSMYAASSGAKLVYAVEASEVAILARKVIQENKIKNVKVIQGAIEKVTLPEKVDVIISEWMGFYLVHEGMLSSIIYARDHLLKPDGLIFPNRATLFASPVDLKSFYETNFSVYDSIDGFSMKCLKNLLWQERLKSPVCESVSPKSVLAFATSIVNWNLDSLTLDQLNDISQTTKFDVSLAGTLRGLTFWFSVSFQSADFCSVLDTSPYLPETHWKQTSVFLPKFTEVEKGDKVVIEIKLEKSKENPRWYEISVEQKSLLEKSFDPVGSLTNAGDGKLNGSSKLDEANAERSEDELGDDNDVIAALIGALSEKYDVDPNEIAQVIANNANDSDTEMD